MVENHFQGEFGEACLDITGGGGGVAGEDVAPVSLGVDEQFLLSQLHQGATDGLVTMRVVFHGVAHDVGHLVVPPVLQLVHGVQDTALHRFQSVVNIRKSTVQNDIRSVVQVPFAVHGLRENDFMEIRGIGARNIFRISRYDVLFFGIEEVVFFI